MDWIVRGLGNTRKLFTEGWKYLSLFEDLFRKINPQEAFILYPMAWRRCTLRMNAWTDVDLSVCQGHPEVVPRGPSYVGGFSMVGPDWGPSGSVEVDDVRIDGLSEVIQQLWRYRDGVYTNFISGNQPWILQVHLNVHDVWKQTKNKNKRIVYDVMVTCLIWWIFITRRFTYWQSLSWSVSTSSFSFRPMLICFKIRRLEENQWHNAIQWNIFSSL